MRRSSGCTGIPRLIDLPTGVALDEWPGVVVSTKNENFGLTHLPTPVAALHPDQQRLAMRSPTTSPSSTYQPGRSTQPDIAALLTTPPHRYDRARARQITMTLNDELSAANAETVIKDSDARCLFTRCEKVDI